MNDLRYEELTHSLLKVLHELKERYQQGLGWWHGPDPPGQYIVFGFVVDPVLRDLLDSNKDPAMLNRIFDFFEEMARSSDIQVPNLLQVGIFEWLAGDKAKILVAWPYMRKETKKIARDTAQRLRSCEKNLPEE
jgi:hypothetical protein